MDQSFENYPAHYNPYGSMPNQPAQDTLPPLPTGPSMGPQYGPTPRPSSMIPMAPTPIPTGPMTPFQMPTMPMQSMPLSAPSPIGRVQPGDMVPITPFNEPIPVTTESLLYLNGFLRTMIGRRVTVDFLIGTNTLTDRTGTLLAVGANYIVINEIESDDIVICDFFSIKFIKVFY